jgi:hypothetical protein
MADREIPAMPVLREADAMAIIATASEAQAAKVRLVLAKLDTIAQLDPRQVQNIAELLRNSVANGGCGIGCW